MQFMTPAQQDAIAGITRLEALYDEALEAADGDVLALRAEVRRLAHDVDRLLERTEHWMTEARRWQAKYMAMRRERNEAMEQWLSFMEHQWAVEKHLEGHEDEVRTKVRATALQERDRVARVLAEIFEVWSLKNGVEAEDLGEAEGSDS